MKLKIWLLSVSLLLKLYLNKHKELTKKVCVQILAMSIGQSLGGGALLLSCLLSSIWVD